MYEQWEQEEAKRQEEIIADIKEFQTSTVIPSKLFEVDYKYKSYEDVIFSKSEREHLIETKPSDTEFTDDDFITECRHLIVQHYYEPNWISNSKTNKRLDNANKAIIKAIGHIGKLDYDTQRHISTNLGESLHHLFNKDTLKGNTEMTLLLKLLLSAQCAIKLSANKKLPNEHDPILQNIFDNLVGTWENVFDSKAAKTEGKFKEFVITMFCHFGKAYNEPEKRIEEAIRNSRNLDREIEKAIQESIVG